MNTKLDIVEFIRHEQSASGQADFAQLPRVLDVLANSNGLPPLHWQVHGRQQVDQQRGKTDVLLLSAQGKATVICARCLDPVMVAIDFQREFRFVADEATALALDNEADDADYLVASRQFDLIELLEDEVLMALPVQATHEHCELPKTNAIAQQQDGKPNPFAILQTLKRTQS
jgi:uncharacterized protein